MPVRPAILLLILFLSGIASRTQNSYSCLVYAAQGSVQLETRTGNRPLKAFDSLRAADVVVLGENARMAWVTVKDKRYFEHAGKGRFSMVQLTSLHQSGSKGTLSKAMQYVIDQFIEKGKKHHASLDYRRAGVVERGEELMPMLYPAEGTRLYRTLQFIPVFNSELLAKCPQFQIEIFKNSMPLLQRELRPGDSLSVAPWLAVGESLSMRVTCGEYVNFITLDRPTAEQYRQLEEELKELDAAGTDMDAEAKLLTRALFFESRSFLIEAAALYEELTARAGSKSVYGVFRQRLFGILQ